MYISHSSATVDREVPSTHLESVVFLITSSLVHLAHDHRQGRSTSEKRVAGPSVVFPYCNECGESVMEDILVDLDLVVGHGDDCLSTQPRCGKTDEGYGLELKVRGE